MSFFKTKQQKHDEEFTKAWNEVVNPAEKISDIRGMTLEKIAGLLSQDDIKGAPRFLLEHELQCRVQKVQNFPQYLILLAMIGGIFLGWLLPQWKPLESKTSLDVIADHIKKHDLEHTTEETKKKSENMKFPITPSPETTPLNQEKNQNRQSNKENKYERNNTKR